VRYKLRYEGKPRGEKVQSCNRIFLAGPLGGGRAVGIGMYRYLLMYSVLVVFYVPVLMLLSHPVSS
jgi:hypothetical protein